MNYCSVIQLSQSTRSLLVHDEYLLKENFNEIPEMFDIGAQDVDTVMVHNHFAMCKNGNVVVGAACLVWHGRCARVREPSLFAMVF